MQDAFISYSRRDRVFVGRLLSALKERELEVWVDLEGLYGGEEYWPEIRKAIEASNAVLWIISPDSVSSMPCGRELQHAVDHSKRIVPIMFREVAPDGLHDELKKRQWMFFRTGDDFEAAVADLVAAIQTDPLWTRTHTRLLVRTREWEVGRFDSSSFLRGRELREVEEWLAGWSGEEPEPTLRQREYIVSSRRATTRRRSLLLGTVAVGLLVLAGIWWYSQAQRVGTLNNSAAFDLNNGRVGTAIASLHKALATCDYLPLAPAACRREVPFNLADAYHREQRYQKAMEWLFMAFEDAEGASPDFLSKAHQSWAVAQIMLADQIDEREERLAAYERAAEALAVARELAGVTGPSVRFDVTSARIHIGRGQWTKAIEQLERVRPFVTDSPDPELLLAVAYDCSGLGLESVESLERYTEKLPLGSKDPLWEQGWDYYKKLTTRCRNDAG